MLRNRFMATLLRTAALVLLWFPPVARSALADPPWGELYQVARAAVPSYIHCPATREEIVQQTMANVWAKVEKLEPMQAKKAYVCKSVKNAAASESRRVATESAHLHQLAKRAPAYADDAAQAASRLEAKEVREIVMKHGDDVDRAILDLRASGHTYRQIAEILDMPLSTVKDRALKLTGHAKQLLLNGATKPVAGMIQSCVTPRLAVRAAKGGLKAAHATAPAGLVLPLAAVRCLGRRKRG